jgi:hypothetical protein
MPDRCNKDAVGQDVPNMTNFQGSFEKAGIVDVAVGLCQTDLERVKDDMRYFVFVNRHGRQYDYFRGKVNQDQMTMTIDHPLNFEMERAKYEEDKQKYRRDRKKRAAMPPELQDER